MLGPKTGVLAPPLNEPLTLFRFAPLDDDIVGDEKAYLHYDDTHSVVRWRDVGEKFTQHPLFIRRS